MIIGSIPISRAQMQALDLRKSERNMTLQLEDNSNNINLKIHTLETINLSLGPSVLLLKSKTKGQPMSMNH